MIFENEGQTFSGNNMKHQIRKYKNIFIPLNIRTNKHKMFKVSALILLTESDSIAFVFIEFIRLR